MYTANFQSGLLTIKKNANEFKLFVCCCWYLVFTSVDLLAFKIKIFDAYLHVYLMSCCKFLIYSWVGVNTNLTTVNFVIYTHQINSKFTTWHYFSLYFHCSRYPFLCLSLYGARGYCQQPVYFLNSLKRKIKHVYFSRLLWRKNELAQVIEPMFIFLWNI